MQLCWLALTRLFRAVLGFSGIAGVGAARTEEIVLMTIAKIAVLVLKECIVACLLGWWRLEKGFWID